MLNWQFDSTLGLPCFEHAGPLTGTWRRSDFASGCGSVGLAAPWFAAGCGGYGKRDNVSDEGGSRYPGARTDNVLKGWAFHRRKVNVISETKNFFPVRRYRLLLCHGLALYGVPRLYAGEMGA